MLGLVTAGGLLSSLSVQAATAVDDYFAGDPDGVHVNIVQNDYVVSEYQITVSVIQGDGAAEHAGEGFLSFIPSAGFTGTAVVRYTLTDIEGSSTANVYIDISADGQPRALDDHIYVPADYSGDVPIPVMDNDYGFGYTAILIQTSSLSPSAAGTVTTQSGGGMFYFIPTPGSPAAPVSLTRSVKTALPTPRPSLFRWAMPVSLTIHC